MRTPISPTDTTTRPKLQSGAIQKEGAGIDHVIFTTSPETKVEDYNTDQLLESGWVEYDDASGAPQRKRNIGGYFVRVAWTGVLDSSIRVSFEPAGSLKGVVAPADASTGTCRVGILKTVNPINLFDKYNAP